MKNSLRLVAALVLALSISTAAIAGDIQGDGYHDPPPPPPPLMFDAGDIQSPGALGSFSDYSSNGETQLLELMLAAIF
jgi:hypothetical protein